MEDSIESGGPVRTKEHFSLVKFLKEHKVQSSKDIEGLFPEMDEKLKKRNSFVDAILKILGPAIVEPSFGDAPLNIYEYLLQSGVIRSPVLDLKSLEMFYGYAARKPSQYDLTWDNVSSSQFSCHFGPGNLWFGGKYSNPNNQTGDNDSWKVYICDEKHVVDIHPPELAENYGDFEKILYTIKQHLDDLGIGAKTGFKYQETISKLD